MSEQFPLLIGRVGITSNWNLDLPRVFQMRMEDGQMVLWRPGFTIWLSAWNNNNEQPVEALHHDLVQAGSNNRYDESTEKRNGRLYHSYRIKEQAEDNRAPAFQGFAIDKHGHLQFSIYFDDEADAGLATDILLSAGTEPPLLQNTAVLSQRCFATTLVTQPGGGVGYMYRETPDNPGDSGWRFFSGTEDQAYVDNPDNTKIYTVASIAESDPAILPYLNTPSGAFGRKGKRFVPE